METNYDATPSQKRTIAKLSSILGDRSNIEELKMTKGEAGKLIRNLSSKISKERKLGRSKVDRNRKSLGRG